MSQTIAVPPATETVATPPTTATPPAGDPATVPALTPAQLAEVEKLLEAKKQEGFQIAQSQLYPTIQKNQEDLKKISDQLATEKAAKEAEAAEKARIAAEEAETKKTLTEKFDTLKAQSTEAINKITQVYDAKIAELQQANYVKDVSMLRRDLIVQADIADWAEFITDPVANPNVTVEQLQKEVELAKTKKEQLLTKVKTELETKANETAAANKQPPQNAFGMPVIGNGFGNISGNPSSQFDVSKVKSADKKQLDAIKDDLFAKFNM